MSTVGSPGNNKRSRRYVASSPIIIMLTIKRCEQIISKYGISIDQQTLLEIKSFLESLARIQIDEEKIRIIN